MDMKQQIIELQQQMADLKEFNSNLLLLLVSVFVMSHNSDTDIEMKNAALARFKSIIDQEDILLSLDMADEKWRLLESMVRKLNLLDDNLKHD